MKHVSCGLVWSMYSQIRGTHLNCLLVSIYYQINIYIYIYFETGNKVNVSTFVQNFPCLFGRAIDE